MEHYFTLPSDACILDIADARSFRNDEEITRFVAKVLDLGLHLPESGPGYERYARAIDAIRRQRPELF